MNLAEDIASEITALMENVKRRNLAGALEHQENALKRIKFALQRLEIEITLRERQGRPLSMLHTIKTMYLDVEKCLIDQRTDIEKLAVVLAGIQARHSGVVGKS